jgi:tetratricopeptide (TPR) repeat protein
VTLPGRGYRFAAPVRIATEQGEALVAQARTGTQIVIEENEEEPAQALKAAPTRRKPRSGRILLLSMAIVAVLLALGEWLSVRSHRRVNPGERNSILVADFVNTTGDPVFADTLRQGMEVELEQSPSLRLVSGDRIRQALGLMGKSPDGRLTEQTTREVCERTGSYAVLAGSGFVLAIRSVNCQTGEAIYDQHIQVAREEDALDAVSRMARGFRVHAGEPAAVLMLHETALADATTSSLKALKAYSLGWKIAGSQGSEPALPYFQRAVAIDPRFAMAYAALGLMFGSSGSSQLATENITRAYELRDRVSDKERFFITAYYLGRAIGNEEKAQQVCEQWAQTYPLEFLAHSFLAGFINPVLANYQGAVEEAQKTIELSPDTSLGYYLLGYNSLYLNDLQGAERAVHMAIAHNTEQLRMATLRFDLAYMKRDAAGMRREVETAHAHPETQDWILDRQAFADASEAG